jgi:hypothetical protein
LHGFAPFPDTKDSSGLSLNQNMGEVFECSALIHPEQANISKAKAPFIDAVKFTVHLQWNF